MADRLTAEDLALRVGVEPARVNALADRGILERGEDGRFAAGDIHRVRLLNAFEDAGVPLDALEAANETGSISLHYYDELHQPPSPPSGRTYGEFAMSLPDASQGHLTRLFGAFGLAEPAVDARLGTEDEALIADLLDTVVATGAPDLALRAIRLSGEGARRSADGALGVYGEAVDRTGENVAGLPVDDVFQRLLRPWARFARQSPTLASWLASRHLTRAIDEYSVSTTELILENAGLIPPREGTPPAVAFVDLTGFTRLTEERGDEAAAAIALRLGEVAAAVVAPIGGRVVKLLGDGALIRFDDAPSAIEATLDLLAALPEAGLPTGHAGIASGSLIVRDNDVFGRTVNLAARIADITPDGHLYLPAMAGASIAESERWTVTPVAAAVLQGIGRIPLLEVSRRA